MVDEVIDTALPPEVGTGSEADLVSQDVDEYTNTGEPVVVEPVIEPVIEPPKVLTPEEIEERAFQRSASWMGRREKEFSYNILRNVTQVLDQRLSQLRPEAPDPKTDLATIFDNPDAWARTEVSTAADPIQEYFNISNLTPSILKSWAEGVTRLMAPMVKPSGLAML